MLENATPRSSEIFAAHEATLAGYQLHLAKPVAAVALLVLIANLAGGVGRDAP